MDKLIIYEMEGYRKPYKWSMETKEGGSFSNSGEYTTKKKCLEHAKAMLSNFDRLPVIYRKVK